MVMSVETVPQRAADRAYWLSNGLDDRTIDHPCRKCDHWHDAMVDVYMGNVHPDEALDVLALARAHVTNDHGEEAWADVKRRATRIKAETLS